MARPELIEWRAPEFAHRAKGVSWYWLSIIIAILILAFALWKRNFLFGLFVVIAEVMILVWSGKEPDTIAFTLGERGLAAGEERLYPLEELTSFSVHDDPANKWAELILYRRSELRPAVRVLVDQEVSAAVHEKLAALIPEVEYQPSLTDVLERLIGF